MTEALTIPDRHALTPRNLSEAMQFAELVAQSDYCPKHLRGKPGSIVIAMQYGMEIGLSPMSSLTDVAVINGRPSVWGAAAMALVRRHPLCEYVRERFDDATMTAVCVIKRRGDPEEHEGVFSLENARTAGLLSKDTWKGYPKDMLMWKARKRASNAAIPEALKGLMFAEEARDIDPEPGPAPVTNGRIKLRARAQPGPVAEPEQAPIVTPTTDDDVREAVVSEYVERIRAAAHRDEVVALFRKARRAASFEGHDAAFAPVEAACKAKVDELTALAEEPAETVNREPGSDG